MECSGAHALKNSVQEPLDSKGVALTSCPQNPPSGLNSGVKQNSTSTQNTLGAPVNGASSSSSSSAATFSPASRGMSNSSDGQQSKKRRNPRGKGNNKSHKNDDLVGKPCPKASSKPAFVFEPGFANAGLNQIRLKYAKFDYVSPLEQMMIVLKHIHPSLDLSMTKQQLIGNITEYSKKNARLAHAKSRRCAIEDGWDPAYCNICELGIEYIKSPIYDKLVQTSLVANYPSTDTDDQSSGNADSSGDMHETAIPSTSMVPTTPASPPVGDSSSGKTSVDVGTTAAPPTNGGNTVNKSVVNDNSAAQVAARVPPDVKKQDVPRVRVGFNTRPLPTVIEVPAQDDHWIVKCGKFIKRFLTSKFSTVASTGFMVWLIKIRDYFKPSASIFSFLLNSRKLKLLLFLMYVLYLYYRSKVSAVPQLASPGVALYDPDDVADRVASPELGKSTVQLINAPILTLKAEGFISAITNKTPCFVDENKRLYQLNSMLFIEDTGRLTQVPSTLMAECSVFWNTHDSSSYDDFLLSKIYVERWVAKVANITPAQAADATMYGPLLAYCYMRNERKNVDVHALDIFESTWWKAVKLRSYRLLCLLLMGLLTGRKKHNMTASLICPPFDAFTPIVDGPFYYYQQIRNSISNLNLWPKVVSLFNFGASKLDSLLSPSGIEKFVHASNSYLNGVVATIGPYFSMITDGWCMILDDINIAFTEHSDHTYGEFAMYRYVKFMGATEKSLQPMRDRKHISVAETFHDCVVAPVYEEQIRNAVGFKFTAFIVLWEAFRNKCFVTAPLHLFNQLIHWTLPKVLALPITVAIHSYYNFLATFMQLPTASSFRRMNYMSWLACKTYPPDVLDLPRPRVLKPSAVVQEPQYVLPPQKIKCRQFLVGFGDNMYRPTYLLPSVDNDRIALETRVLKATPVPNVAVLHGFSTWFKRNVFKILPKLKHRVGFDPPPFSEYIKKSNASPTVKKLLIDTRALMEEEGINESTILSAADLADYGVKSSFLKVENTVYRSMGRVKQKAGRLIQGSRPRYLCLMGPWFQRLQSYIKRDLNKNNFLCFTSGVSTKDCASLITELDNEYVENDVSAWDSSLDIEFARLELWLCRMLRAPAAVLQLMENNIKKRGRTFFGFKYSVDGTRASGEPFTSLFNSLWNCCIHLFIFCFSQGVTIQQARLLIRGLFQGDDCLLSIPKNLRINWRFWFRCFGFDCKAIVKFNPIDLEFCSMRLYPVEGGHCFGPKIGKVISKIGYFINPPHYLHPCVLLRGVALGLLPASSFLKPLECVLSKILQLTEPHFALPMHREEWQMRFSVCKATPATDVAINYHYNLTGDLLTMFINEIGNLKLGSDTVGPCFRYVCDKDTSGDQFYLH